MTNKYAEGYPGRRYYGGCEFVDVAESLAIARAKAAVRRRARQRAAALGRAGQHVGVLRRREAGRHGARHEPGAWRTPDARASAQLLRQAYNIVPYGVRKDDERIDYEELERLARRAQAEDDHGGRERLPACDRFSAHRAVAKAVGAPMVVDMAHIAGLVAAGVHPTPVPHADFVTRRRTRRCAGRAPGSILCREQYAKEIDRRSSPVCRADR